MKKQNMTKLALMGIASGLLVSGQAVAADHNAAGTQIARGGCGAKCSAQKTPSRDRRYNGQVADNSDAPAPKSCSAKASCNGQQQPAPQSCSGRTSCNGQQQYVPQTNCSGHTSCSGQRPAQPRGNCSGRSSCHGINV